MDTPHTERYATDLDDDDLGLPRREGGAGAEDEALVDEDAELDIDLGGDERVGLDAAVGVDDDRFDDTLDDSDGAEATQWTAGSEEARDLDVEADVPEGEEYGWTEANEPPDDIDLAAELDDEPEAAAPSDDRGEEGPDEVLDEALGLAGRLPPLDADAEEPADDEPFALDVLREVTGGLPDEPERAPNR